MWGSSKMMGSIQKRGTDIALSKIKEGKACPAVAIRKGYLEERAFECSLEGQRSLSLGEDVSGDRTGMMKGTGVGE